MKSFRGKKLVRVQKWVSLFFALGHAHNGNKNCRAYELQTLVLRRLVSQYDFIEIDLQTSKWKPAYNSAVHTLYISWVKNYLEKMEK